MNDPIITAAVNLQKALEEEIDNLPPEALTAMEEIMKILTLAAPPSSTDTDVVGRLVSRFEKGGES